MSATVYLVGAGPGAADLLTLRAVNLLRGADIVFHDALVTPEVLAFCPTALKVKVGKRSGRLSTAQRFINKQLVDAARRYGTVVRLKGGDPMLFARAQEEIAHLRKEGIRCVVVPGVTAALAASADLGVSLTRRGVSRSVAFVTPRAAEGEPASPWVGAALAADTVGIYMGAGEADAISRALIAAGKPAHTPAVVVENASLPGRRSRAGLLKDLAAIAASGAGGPVLILLGEVYAEQVADQRRGAKDGRTEPRAIAA